MNGTHAKALCTYMKSLSFGLTAKDCYAEGNDYSLRYAPFTGNCKTLFHSSGYKYSFLPCFCFFDSDYAADAMDSKKLAVARKLKNFLKKLWLATYKNEYCDWSELTFFNVKCPQQNNRYDCGMFVLQFAERFFQTPITRFEHPINVTHWFDQRMITEKRKEIKSMIAGRM